VKSVPERPADERAADRALGRALAIILAAGRRFVDEHPDDPRAIAFRELVAREAAELAAQDTEAES
jgi:hypothetical protein